MLLTTAVIEVPFLANAFELVDLSIAEYAIALALAVNTIPFVEGVKAVGSLIGRRKTKK